MMGKEKRRGPAGVTLWPVLPSITVTEYSIWLWTKRFVPRALYRRRINSSCVTLSGGEERAEEEPDVVICCYFYGLLKLQQKSITGVIRCPFFLFNIISGPLSSTRTVPASLIRRQER